VQKWVEETLHSPEDLLLVRERKRWFFMERGALFLRNTHVQVVGKEANDAGGRSVVRYGLQVLTEWIYTGKSNDGSV